MSARPRALPVRRYATGRGARLGFALLLVGLAAFVMVAGCVSSRTDAPGNTRAAATRVVDGGPVRALGEVYERHFAIGAAVQPGTLITHDALLVRHMNSLTPENHLKLHMVRPHPGVISWTGADAIVDYAGEHGMRVRGHALVWHEAAPEWFFHEADGSEASREVVRDRLREHILETVGRYRGRIHAWDVVNEAVADSAGEGLLRPTRWLEALGPEYIALAFRAAHEADPGALLFYNDYSLVEPRKRDRTLRLLRELIAEGVPVHGVGLQGHWTLTWPPVRLIGEAIRAFADLGLRVEITELDISFYDWNDHEARFDAFTAEMDRALALRYDEIFSVLRDHADLIDAVTFWGAADDVSWLNYTPVPGRPNYPLLFDRRHQPKAAYFRVTDF